MARGKWLLFGGVVVLLAIAGGAISALWREAHQKKSVVLPVAAAHVEPAISELNLQGRVEAQKVVPIAAPVDGTITEFFVNVGDAIYEGELLGRIRNVQLENRRELATAELERCEARLAKLEADLIAARLEASRAIAERSRAQGEADRAEKVFQRQLLLASEGATPRLTFEKAQKEYEVARAERDTADLVAKQADERVTGMTKQKDQAQKTLDDRNQEMDRAKADLAAADVHAPFDGLLVARQGDVGVEVTRETKDLFLIAVDLGQLQVVVEPSPQAMGLVRPGLPAMIFFADIPDEAIPGTVKEIKAGQVIIDFQSPTEAIRPGLSAQVRIKLT